MRPSDPMNPDTMSIVLASTSDRLGGAARAAIRLHRSLADAGHQSRMVVDHASSGEFGIEGPPTPTGRLGALLRQRAHSAILRLQRTEDRTIRSSGLVPGSAARRLRKMRPSVINVHWVGNGYISLRQLARLQAPTIWTLHDMWVFNGAEHYSDDGADARWRTGYTRQNRPSTHGGLDIDRLTWRRKARLWRQVQHIVTPSRWMAECASSSALLQGWPCTVIPNPLPLDIFRPIDQRVARDVLRLPHQAPVVLFGAMGGDADRRKGFDLLRDALGKLVEDLPDAIAVVFGAAEPSNSSRLPLPVHWTGVLHDDVTLALLYSAADVMVVPSRQDNLPQTGTEAQACGTPVVAFDTAGLPDVIEDRGTGYLAEPFDPEDLARGIAWVLEDRQRSQRLSAQARKRAEQLWAPDTVARQYIEVYRQALDDG